jgi:hypothetical protein
VAELSCGSGGLRCVGGCDGCGELWKAADSDAEWEY